MHIFAERMGCAAEALKRVLARKVDGVLHKHDVSRKIACKPDPSPGLVCAMTAFYDDYHAIRPR